MRFPERPSTEGRWSAAVVLPGVVVVLGSGALMLHFVLGFLAIARPAAAPEAVQAADDYTSGVFDADWRLFAPFPPRDEVVYEVRGEVQTPAGARWVTEWHPLGREAGEPGLWRPQSQRFGQVIAGLGSRRASAVERLEDYDSRRPAHGGDDDDGTRALLQQEVDESHERLMRAALDTDGNLQGQPVVAVQIAEVVISHPDFDDRDSDPQVDRFELDWRPVR